MEPVPSHPSSNQPVLGLIERLNRWLQESVMIKMLSIGFMIIILLLPASWIQDLIYERQQRANDVISEITDKWSGSQSVSGPVLVIPFRQESVIDRGKEGIERREDVLLAYFLPEHLSIDGDIAPEIRHRGIFDAVVYTSSLDVKAHFARPNFSKLGIAEDKVNWKDAYLVTGITDLGGISDDLIFQVGGDTLEAEPSDNIGIVVDRVIPEANGTSYAVTQEDGVSSTGVTAKLNWDSADKFQNEVQVKIKLKGSSRIDFVPAGKTTDVNITSTWNNPSFDGKFIPIQHDVNEKGFTANWKVLHFNRPFAQQWIGHNQQLRGAGFGIKLLLPVDQYQKSIRTSKYGILVILLTFVALLLVEIIRKIRIHPFQYILIGAALTIYYTLLLSFSEHVGYNIAYVVASAATVLLISLYASTFLRQARLVLLFSLLLVIFYSFIFVIILQQDFSLLLGSVGLFLIVGAIMYFSRRVKWYNTADETVTR